MSLKKIQLECERKICVSVCNYKRARVGGGGCLYWNLRIEEGVGDVSLADKHSTNWPGSCVCANSSSGYQSGPNVLSDKAMMVFRHNSVKSGKGQDLNQSQSPEKWKAQKTLTSIIRKKPSKLPHSVNRSRWFGSHKTVSENKVPNL